MEGGGGGGVMCGQSLCICVERVHTRMVLIVACVLGMCVYVVLCTCVLSVMSSLVPRLLPSFCRILY